MTDTVTAFAGADVFDGQHLHADHALLVRGSAVEAVVPATKLSPAAARTELDGGTLAPGLVDLQVNGGGGVMFNEAPTVETLATIARAHATLGTTALLPTLITDRPEATLAALEAAVRACEQKMPGIAGLHLEGPHLSLARKGAHDPALIRPMTDADLAFLLSAKERLPSLMVTVAPESVSPGQIEALALAGIVVSLGHTDAGLAACDEAVRHGARCATHLFNAMSQLGSREPGLVGAVLSNGDLSAGLIADMAHVHHATISTALRAKQGPGRIFLVTDAMAPAGSTIGHFQLNGRRVERRDGRLTLDDGTLAGADLDLPAAVRNMVQQVGLPLSDALAMATSVPAGVIGRQADLGALKPGRRADFVHLDAALNLRGVWRGGQPARA